MSRKLSDWLQHYMKFTENSESPTSYHLWSGIAAISSALGRKCYINPHRKEIYPNFYICLVGPPGGRKGTAMSYGKPLVQAIKLPMGADFFGSVQALYKKVNETKKSFKDTDGETRFHRSLAIWSEEFQVFLSDRDPQLMASITDLFDCPSNWRYEIQGKVTDLGCCFLTILGAITPSLLQTKLSLDAVGGGLVSRIIFVVGYGAIKKIPFSFLTEEELLLEKDLIHDLEQIRDLQGEFKMGSEFMNHYSKWYIHSSPDDGVPMEKFAGYNSRRPLHLLKLCMIVCASESNDMLLKPHHLDTALAIIETTEEDMVNAFHGFGLGSHATKIAKVLSWVESQTDFSHETLLNKFYMDCLPEELTLFMTVAEDRGLLTKNLSPSNKMSYTVKTKKIKSKGEDSLRETVYRLMTDNIIKERI